MGIELDWIRLDWIGWQSELDWIGLLVWIGIGLDWDCIEIDALRFHDRDHHFQIRRTDTVLLICRVSISYLFLSTGRRMRQPQDQF